MILKNQQVLRRSLLWVKHFEDYAPRVGWAGVLKAAAFCRHPWEAMQYAAIGKRVFLPGDPANKDDSPLWSRANTNDY